jgi:glycosyltransferase involved in cell wall biosynthesis
MNLLIIIPIMDKNYGGMERFVIDFSNSIIESGNKVTIITSRSRFPIEIKDANIIRHRIFFPKILNKLIKYSQLSFIANRHLKKNKYDFIFAMGFSGILLDDFIWRASGSPIRLVKAQKNELNKKKNFIIRTLINLDLSIQEKLESICIKKAKIHIFPSTELKSSFEASYRFSAKKTFIPCSGIDFSIKKPKQNLLDWGKIKDKTKILIANGLSEDRKGREIIIEAMKKIDLKDICFIVVGNNSVIFEKKISKHMINLGKIDYTRMHDVYKNCDFLIFPSFFEGFPNTLLEAASYGLPIISTRLDGIAEYFKEGEDIILIKKNSSDELANAIIGLASSKSKRDHMSKSIREKVKKLNYKYFTKELLDFIDSDIKTRNLLK